VAATDLVGVSLSRAREQELALSVYIVWVCIYTCLCVFVCEFVYIYERHIYRAWMTWQCRHSETKRLARAADKVISLILTMLSCSDGSVPASSEAKSASMPPQHPDLLSCFDACSETLLYCLRRNILTLETKYTNFGNFLGTNNNQQLQQGLASNAAQESGSAVAQVGGARSCN
jgi:hypothetical protein